MGVPLERALSKRGIASRTQAREWIQAGRVRVNGIVQKDPLFSVSLEKALIEVDGQAAIQATRIVLMLHKVKGVVTTHSDEKGRPTVFSLLNGPKQVGEPSQGRWADLHLHAVGRLDLATTGLLLLTNDTRLSAWLTNPRNAIPRVYIVTVRNEVTADKVKLLETGIQDEGELLRADQVLIRKASKKETHLTVTLTQGKNREIRRLFKSIGHELTRLKRVAFGDLQLGELKPGEYREISIEEFRKAFPGFSEDGLTHIPK